MSKPKQPSTPESKVSSEPQYFVKREDGGYVVYQDGKRATEPDVLQMAFAKLTILIRKDLGL